VKISKVKSKKAKVKSMKSVPHFLLLPFYFLLCLPFLNRRNLVKRASEIFTAH